jgi:hypothetical protein
VKSQVLPGPIITFFLLLGAFWLFAVALGTIVAAPFGIWAIWGWKDLRQQNPAHQRPRLRRWIDGIGVAAVAAFIASAAFTEYQRLTRTTVDNILYWRGGGYFQQLEQKRPVPFDEFRELAERSMYHRHSYGIFEGSVEFLAQNGKPTEELEFFETLRNKLQNDKTIVHPSIYQKSLREQIEILESRQATLAPQSPPTP